MNEVAKHSIESETRGVVRKLNGHRFIEWDGNELKSNADPCLQKSSQWYLNINSAYHQMTTGREWS